MAPPDDYGWAYIDPQRASASADGPSGSVQFRYGSEDLSPGQFSGSEDLVFYAANDGHTAEPHSSGSALYLYGNLYVTGAVHASTYNVRNITSTEIDISGSTIFGDTSGDTHQRTGSFEAGGPIHLGKLDSGTGSVSVTTFYNTLTGAAGAGEAGGDIHADKLIVNDIYVSGSAVGIQIAMADDEVATWGDSNDLTIVHDGSNTTMTNDTGHFIINSNSTVGKLILKTGTNTAATQVNILDNSGATLFGTTGAGNTFFGTSTSTSDHAITGTLCVSGLEHQVTGTLEVSGKVNLATDLLVGGILKMSDNTAGKILVGDGTSYQEITVSGDATISSAGSVTIAAGAIEHGMLAEDIISGQAELVHAEIADADELMISDAGTIKRVGVDSLQNHYFGKVSGDATVADGGALTIAANAVEGSMLNTDVISGQTNMTGDVADLDELLVSDAGTLKRIDFSVFRAAVFNDISGDATIAGGGTLTIAAGSLTADKLDIDGSTDIGAALADADLFIVDDGAGGTNRKATASRIKTYTKTDATPGVAATGKAVVLGGSKNIATLGTVGCGAITSTGASTFGSVSGSSTLSSLGATHLGDTLTMDGAGIVFNVAASAGTVDLQVNDGSGADTAITLGKNGKVTKIGDDTPSDGQYLSWDATGGKVAWADGLTVWGMSGSDNHYSSTEIRTSGPLNVTGSSMLAGDVTTTGSIYVADDIVHYGDNDTKISFGPDHIAFSAGGADMLTLSEGAQDLITVNPDGNDVDFHVLGAGITNALFIEGSSGATSIANTLTVGSHLYVDGNIFHTGDVNTNIGLTTDNMTFNVGGEEMLTFSEGASDTVKFCGGGNIDFFVGSNSHSASIRSDGTNGDVHLCGDQFTFDQSDAALTIKPSSGSKKAIVRLYSKDTTATDDAELQFLRYTDQSQTQGDDLGSIEFKGSHNDATGTGAFVTAVSIVAEADGDWLPQTADPLTTAPGRLTFSTCRVGDNTMVPRLRLASDGLVTAYGDIAVGGEIHHYNDDNTKIAFTSDEIVLTAGGAEMISITESTIDTVNLITAGGGRVGINRSAPASDLHILQGGTTIGVNGIRVENPANNYWTLYNAATNSFHFTYNGISKGYLGSVTSVAIIDFTGQHRSDSAEALKDPSNVGLIVSSTGVLSNLETGTLANINESLPVVELSATGNDKKVYGVISDVEDPNSTSREYATGAFVSVYEKQDNRLIINSLGEGAVWIINKDGPMENGDYITTCTVPGYGVPQADDLLHNYTVAKITQDCSFDLSSTGYTCEEITIDGVTYLRALVACTYHCG